MAERFETHSRTFSLLTLASRVTGLAREAALSRIFGAAGVMDAFFFAFIIPNLFRRLFGEGALAAAFLPVYARLDKSDPADARRLATLTVAGMAVALGSITLIGEIVLYFISHLAEHQHLAVRLMMIMLPYLPMVCVVAILGAMLQVHGRFGPTAAAPIVLNLALIAAAVGMLLVLPGENEVAHISTVAAAVLVAGVLQVAWSLWALRDQRWLVRDAAAAAPVLRRVRAQAGPMILGLGVLQLNTFFDGLIASYPTTVGMTIFGLEYPLREGAMAAVTFAQRLYQVPLGVFGLAIATAIFPALVRRTDDDDAFADILRRGLRMVVFLGLPASAGLMLIGRPLATVILEGGDFTQSDSRRVAFVLLGYSSAVWAYSMIHVLTRAFYAKGDPRTPVKVAVGIVAVNLALNCTLIWTPLREAGLAWSTALCATIQAVVLLARARRHVAGLVAPEVAWSWIRSAVITAVMVLTMGVVLVALGEAGSWSRSLGTLVVAVVAGGSVVFISARALGMPELRWALGRREQERD
ncbi:MAG: murein biosynthesis integral membrane protein MurJ [Planctomycetota bacterium]|jgi:putative peptidoglycan lipid II flippase